MTAFNADKLSKMQNLRSAGAAPREHSLWFYDDSGNSVATLAAAGYFNTARGSMNVGDLVYVDASDGVHVLKLATIPADGTSNVTTTLLTQGGAVKTVRGQATTVTASDTIAVAGLASLAGVIATMDSDPVAGCQFATASIGDQAGAPVAGSFLLKTWKDTATADTAKIAATTFGKKVNWTAWGPPG